MYSYFIGLSCSKVVVLRSGLCGHLSCHSRDMEQQISKQLHRAEPATTDDTDTQPVSMRVTLNQSLMCICGFKSDLILHRSSNRPCSSSGSSSAMAVSAYMLMIRWPARSAVSLTYSFSSARACGGKERRARSEITVFLAKICRHYLRMCV